MLKTRTAVLTALIGCAAIQPATAQGAGGALPLVISATGSVHTPADRITLLVIVSGTGKTDAAVKADLATKLGKVRSTIVAAGVDPARIGEKDQVSRLGFVGNEAYQDDEDGGQPSPPGRVASCWLRIELGTPSEYERVRKAILDQGIAITPTPFFELKDDRAAHAAAVTEAIRKARAEADLYAAAIGYHAVRIIKVENSLAPNEQNTTVGTMLRSMSETQMGEVQDVLTEASVTITFDMVPR